MSSSIDPTGGALRHCDQEKLTQIFKRFDEDQNGLLSLKEANTFMEARRAPAFSKHAWKTLCKRAGAKSSKGLQLQQISAMYDEVKDGFLYISHVDADYKLIFESPAEEEAAAEVVKAQEDSAAVPKDRFTPLPELPNPGFPEKTTRQPEETPADKTPKDESLQPPSSDPATAEKLRVRETQPNFCSVCSADSLIF